MVWRRSNRPNRIPKVDAATLDDRTRPLADGPSPFKLRIGYLGWTTDSNGLEALAEKKRDRAMMDPRAIR